MLRPRVAHRREQPLRLGRVLLPSASSPLVKPHGVVLYNIMLAIARQPGRERDAAELRQQYLEELKEAESIYDDLPSRLQREQTDKAIYAGAKQKVQHGELKLNGVWWIKNQAVLRRTQLGYGLLDLDAT